MKIVAIECIFQEKINTFFVIDIYEWEGKTYTDYCYESRQFFMNEKVREINSHKDKGLFDIKFSYIEQLSTSVENLDLAY